MPAWACSTCDASWLSWQLPPPSAPTVRPHAAAARAAAAGIWVQVPASECCIQCWPDARNSPGAASCCLCRCSHPTAHLPPVCWPCSPCAAAAVLGFCVLRGDMAAQGAWSITFLHPDTGAWRRVARQGGRPAGLLAEMAWHGGQDGLLQLPLCLLLACASFLGTCPRPGCPASPVCHHPLPPPLPCPCAEELVQLSDSWRYVLNYMAAAYAPQASFDLVFWQLLLLALSRRSWLPGAPLRLGLWHPDSSGLRARARLRRGNANPSLMHGPRAAQSTPETAWPPPLLLLLPQIAVTFFAGVAGWIVLGFTAYQLYLICTGAAAAAAAAASCYCCCAMRAATTVWGAADRCCKGSLAAAGLPPSACRHHH